jgi:hypothetical protein
MSWHFSQALVEAYSADTCSDGAPSAPSSSTPTRGMYWSPGKTMGVSPLSRSGMTYEPSMDDRGEAVLTSYLAAFPARTSAPPERESASPASDPACGGRWQESSVKFDPASCSWKTHRCLWEEDLDWCSVTFPKWGMMLTGVLWEPTTQAPPINGTGSGLWPTIRAADGERGGRGDLIQAIRGNPNSHYNFWQTPVADDAVERVSGKFNSRGEPKLSAQVKMFPTPYGLSASQRQGDGGSGARSMMTEEEKKELCGGQLNPTWVEWLMGWPLGWTDCAVSATDKFRQWQRSHGIS